MIKTAITENKQAKNAAHFVDVIFGYEPKDPDSSDGKLLKTNIAAASQFLEELTIRLATLTPREEKVLKMLYGLGSDGEHYTQNEVGQHFAVTRYRIRTIESKALRKLRHPMRSRGLRHFIEEFRRLNDYPPVPSIEIVEAVELLKSLTPELIKHLASHSDDLIKIHPRVAEHLIAELLKANGFSDVRLVGQNPETSADVFAVTKLNSFGVEIRIYVEVKRWKEKVGIGVINQVLGAMISEKGKLGWHAAMIVTTVGFTKFRKWTNEELRMMGIELKDKDDLLKLLVDYQQAPSGLWLPNPPKMLP